MVAQGLNAQGRSVALPSHMLARDLQQFVRLQSVICDRAGHLFRFIENARPGRTPDMHSRSRRPPAPGPQLHVRFIVSILTH
jgi:hypothetical protein